MAEDMEPNGGKKYSILLKKCLVKALPLALKRSAAGLLAGQSGSNLAHLKHRDRWRLGTSHGLIGGRWPEILSQIAEKNHSILLKK